MESVIWVFILLAVLIVVVGVIAFVVIFSLGKKEQERYEESIQRLDKQLTEGKLSEDTYKNLRMELEREHHKFMR